MSFSLIEFKKKGFVDAFLRVKKLINRETHEIICPKGSGLVEILYVI